MLIEIPPKISVSNFMGFLKGKSSLMIYEKWGNTKFKYRNREFWCRGYYVHTVGKDAKKIKEYLQKQLSVQIELKYRAGGQHPSCLLYLYVSIT